IRQCTGAVALRRAVGSANYWIVEIVISAWDVPSEECSQHLERIVCRAGSIVLFDVAKHPNDLGSLDLANWAGAKRWEDIAGEGAFLLIQAAQLFNVVVNYVFVLDNPAQCVGTGVPLLLFGRERVFALSNVAKDGFCLSLGLLEG